MSDLMSDAKTLHYNLGETGKRWGQMYMHQCLVCKM